MKIYCAWNISHDYDYNNGYPTFCRTYKEALDTYHYGEEPKITELDTNSATFFEDLQKMVDSIVEPFIM